MKKHGISRLSFSGLCKERLSLATTTQGAASFGVAILLLMTATALGQAAPAPAEATQDGFAIHQTADLGGHMVNRSGSGAMYDTLINIQSGPRVLGETFTMHALEGTKHPLLDSLSVFSSGFGGDPNNFAKMDFSKEKLYEFSGVFRRDRQYFDYDLLGNPSIPGGQTIPYGLVANVATAGSLLWPQVTQSPVMFNSVRRMTDLNLTILPLSKVSFRVGYSHNIFQGPTLSPGRSVGKYDMLLQEYQRNSTDDALGAIDWKPNPHTKITFEELIDHYKADSYFTLAPSAFIAQEADGTPVALGNWDSVVPYGGPYGGTTGSIGVASACNTGSMGSAYTSATTYTLFSAPLTGGLPIINPACDVVTSYLRSQPTRIIYPTELLRMQSTSLKNIAMNGDFRYSISKIHMPSFYENWTGLDGAMRSATFTGAARGQRRVVGLDYGFAWHATKTITLEDQVDFSNVHQPGNTNVTNGITVNTATNPNETINYTGPTTAGTYSITGNPTGSPLYGYFGQKFVTNSATASWDASSRATLALTYRYKTHSIVQGNVTSPGSTEIDINENAGIFNAALRPTNHLEMNGTIEMSYADNAFTPVAPRQLKHYRFHTMYRPKTWATVSGAYNDLERHDNTNNIGPSVDGPIGHVDHSRTVSLGVALAPTEHYSLNFDYSYSDIYTSTNICYLSGTTGTTGSLTTVTGTASTNSAGAPNLCPSLLTDWGPVKDFMDAPTQYASISATYSPNKAIRSAFGYRISAVSGNQFFADAQQVNGSLQSAYQSPFVNVAWKIHPGLVWRVEYNYFGYGEGGPSGAPFCSNSTLTTSVVVPCNSSSVIGPTGLTEPSSGLSAPRNFHANNVTLAMHYEF